MRYKNRREYIVYRHLPRFGQEIILFQKLGMMARKSPKAFWLLSRRNAWYLTWWRRRCWMRFDVFDIPFLYLSGLRQVWHQARFRGSSRVKKFQIGFSLFILSTVSSGDFNFFSLEKKEKKIVRTIYQNKKKKKK